MMKLDKAKGRKTLETLNRSIAGLFREAEAEGQGLHQRVNVKRTHDNQAAEDGEELPGEVRDKVYRLEQYLSVADVKVSLNFLHTW